MSDNNGGRIHANALVKMRPTMDELHRKNQSLEDNILNIQQG